MSTSRELISLGSTRQVFGSASSTTTPASRSVSTVIAMCGSLRYRLAVVVDGDALVVAGAGQEEGGDELRRGGRVEGHQAARTEPVPSTTTGSVPRPPSSNATPRVRRASSTGPIGRTRACGSPSNSTRPSRQGSGRRQEPHDRAGQPDIDVDATPEGLRWPDHPVRDRGDLVDRHTRTVVSLRGDVLDLDAERAQPGGHQQGVARAERLAEPGPVAGQRGQDEEPVGQRLAAGQRDRRLDGPARGRGGPVAGMAGVSGGGRGGRGHGCGSRFSSGRPEP